MEHRSSSTMTVNVGQTHTLGRIKPVCRGLSNHSCDGNSFKWYSSMDDNITDVAASSRLESSGSFLKILTIPLAQEWLLESFAVVLCYRCRSKRRQGKYTSTLLSNDTTALHAAIVGQKGLWNDDVITAKRIPRDKVKMKQLTSRGANGEVYRGTFNGQQVAVKILLPSSRENLQRVMDLLTEAKMTASMDHPQIVFFIGVAWDSLSDLCLVLEFMDGGDLRTLLDKYEASEYPVGFIKQKTSVAFQVCQALTYLHSLKPPVIHRDLKSRNILLNEAMDAKLTDFGISKERHNQSMTTGVGTTLWMAPGVMLGENYDTKADMFAFGVVLSELDVHSLPYSHVKQRGLDSDGQEMLEAVLLRKLTAREVEFSESSPFSVVELGWLVLQLTRTNARAQRKHCTDFSRFYHTTWHDLEELRVI